MQILWTIYLSVYGHQFPLPLPQEKNSSVVSDVTIAMLIIYAGKMAWYISYRRNIFGSKKWLKCVPDVNKMLKMTRNTLQGCHLEKQSFCQPQNKDRTYTLFVFAVLLSRWNHSSLNNHEQLAEACKATRTLLLIRSIAIRSIQKFIILGTLLSYFLITVKI